MTTTVVAEAVELYLGLGRVTRLLRRAGAPGELSPGAASALATLVRDGPMRQGDLAGREQVTAPTMSRIVAALEQGGYVERDADPEDGRATQVRASGVGSAIVTGLTSERTRALGEVLGRLSTRERRGLLVGLAALERSFDA